MGNLPSKEELAEMRNEFTNGLLVMREQTEPLFDAADAMRADLDRRGWSPAAAEQAALTWLCGSIASMFGDQS